MSGELLARVKAATGSDPSIDLAVHVLIEDGRDEGCLPYTASLDAVVALIERKLPDCSWSARNEQGTPHWAAVDGWVTEGATPALALLAALLAALLTALESPDHD